VSGAWRREYDPDGAHVTGGVPAEIVAEVERLATQLTEPADVGVDISDTGNGPEGCAAWTRPAAGSLSWPLPGTARSPS
jgi:hypothetical protein